MYQHTPVLLHEVSKLLNPKPNQNFIDGTVGGGGHAAQILSKTEPNGRLIGLDLDPRARTAAKKRLNEFGSRAIILSESYADIEAVVKRYPEYGHISGVILDLGLSSDQLMHRGRGFSFYDTGALDMRFNPNQGESAAEILRRSSKDELQRILETFGEVEHASRVAQELWELVQEQSALQSLTTESVVNAIERVSFRKRKIHPATQVFQALRIAVNRELENLKLVLPQLLNVVMPQGRCAIISYHSLEDRIVKNFFRREARNCICPSIIPLCTCQHRATVKLITKKAVQPTPEEIRDNPRSRSAQLRVIEII